MIWTQENIKTMETLHSQGLSSSKIAKQIGTTKNAVLGKMYRAKIKNGYVPLYLHPNLKIKKYKRYQTKIRSSYFPKTGEKRKCNLCPAIIEMRSRFDRFCWKCKRAISGSCF
jgi:hypothetical protein